MNDGTAVNVSRTASARFAGGRRTTSGRAVSRGDLNLTPPHPPPLILPQPILFTPQRSENRHRFGKQPQ